MCKKSPGKRCSGYEARRLARAQQRATSGTSEDLAYLSSVLKDYDATPRGIKDLTEQIASHVPDQDTLERYRNALQNRSPDQVDIHHASVSDLVPRSVGDYGRYYAQNDAKHFADTGVAGSKFTDGRLTKTEDVLELARAQRGTVEGDDRNAFIAMGCSPQAFRPGARYLMVRTSGTVGIVRSEDMDDSTPVRITRDKIGAPCSASVEVDAKPTADYACVVIGTNEDGREVVFSAFPGPVTTPGTGLLDQFEGQTITVAKIRDVFGSDVHLLTRLRSSNR